MAAIELHTVHEIMELLKQVPDPEVPVLNIIDLGIIRRVETKDHTITVDITPTYSGCPAMDMIEKQVKELLSEAGFMEIQVNTVYSPAWTTDWLTEEAKQKLLEYGIAPPVHSTINKKALLGKESPVIRCPQCKSTNTEMKSQFGSTACKALYICKDCLEPFDYFKCI